MIIKIMIMITITITITITVTITITITIMIMIMIMIIIVIMTLFQCQFGLHFNANEKTSLEKGSSYKYSNMAPRLSGQSSIFGVVFLHPSLFWEFKDKRN